MEGFFNLWLYSSLVRLHSARKLTPLGIPAVEQLELRFNITALAVGKGVTCIEVQRIFLVTLQNHHVLEVKHEVWACIKG